jgi:ferredoxin-type protein NapH
MAKTNDPRFPNRATLQSRGFFKATRWLLLRRLSQFSILLLFLSGPWFGLWLLKGNLSANIVLDTIPLTDPLLLLQSMLAGNWPIAQGLIGAAIILSFYLLAGGRVYCAWVCPVNLLTDAAAWLRRKMDIRTTTRLERNFRYWLLGLILVFPLLFGVIAWELVNPVSMAHRGIIFGMGLGWTLLLAVFLFDLLMVKHGWCGHFCPVGAFYSLVGHFSPLRMIALNRQRCDDCNSCFHICPEPQVIRPALKGAPKGIGPTITSGNCTHCGRCIDVCDQSVFVYGNAYKKHEQPTDPVITQ